MRFKRAQLGSVALLCGLALVLGACGDDDDDDDAGGAGSGSSAPAPTGPPIKIGFINTENSPAGNYPDLREGAEAAVKYINGDLGGVAGRPLEMDVCIADGSGESSIGCANKFVQGGVVAVSYGLDFGGGGSTPVFAKAGIPVLGGIGTEPPQLTSPNNFLYVGGIAGAMPSSSRYIGEHMKPKKVGMIAPELPAAHSAVDTYSKPVLAKSGVTDVNVVFESPTAADFTPALTKVNQGNPDAILVVFGGSACAKIMQASQQLGIPTSAMVYLQTCTGADTLQAGGAGAEGIVAQTPYLSPQSDDPEVGAYRGAMEKYAPDVPVGTNSQTGFSFIMNIADLMSDLQGDVTKEALLAAIKTSVNRPSFMSHPYTCDGKQFPGLVSICNASERILKYENGEFTDVLGEWIEGISQLG